MELRPLGFGEIFDRAITLYVRNLVPFAAIVFVLIVPLAFERYLLDEVQSGRLDQMIRILTHRETRIAPAWYAFGSPQTFALVVLLAAIVVYTLLPFALNAVAVGVARLYRGRPVEFGACYATSLRRWPAVLGVIALGIAIVVAWYAGVVFAIVAMSLLAGMAFAVSHPLGIVAFIGVALGALALILSLLPLVLALTFAMYAAVIEERGARAAIASGFRRIFTREEFWRAVLFAVASSAIGFGGEALVAVVVGAALYLHAIGVAAVLESLFDALFLPFSTVLVAVYYFDVRIRREGFDLESALARLAAPPSLQID